MTRLKGLLLTAVCGGALALFSTPAMAKGPEKAAPSRVAQKTAKPRPAKRARRAQRTQKKPTRRAKYYDFLGDEVTGDFVRPEGDDIKGRPKVTHTNLIKYRTQFIREITRQADYL